MNGTDTINYQSVIAGAVCASIAADSEQAIISVNVVSIQLPLLVVFTVNLLFLIEVYEEPRLGDGLVID